MAVSASLKKKLEKKREKLKSGGGLGYMTFKEGTTRIRILSAGSDEDFAIEATSFYLGKEIGGFISPITFGEPCYASEVHDEVKKRNDEDDEELLKVLRPKKAYFVCALKMDEKGKKVEEGPKLARITKGLYENLIDLMLDEDNGDFTDPNEGYDIKIKRTGSGQYDTEYTCLPGKPLKLDKQYRGHQDLEKMLRGITASYEETQEFMAKFLGEDLDDDSKKGKKSKDKDKSSGKKSKEKTSSKKGKATPSSDLDGPAKKKKKKKSSK